MTSDEAVDAIEHIGRMREEAKALHAAGKLTDEEYAAWVNRIDWICGRLNGGSG